TEDGTIIYDPKEKIVYIGDTIYAILKDGKASRNPDKALKLIYALSKLDAEYFVAFHNGVYEREPLFRYFNTVKLAIEMSRKSSNWEVAKAYFEKKYQTATTDTLKRLYDSVLN